jgi:hypothetical protein
MYWSEASKPVAGVASGPAPLLTEEAMNDNVQDLVDRLRKPGYMNASLIAAALIEKLAALPDELLETPYSNMTINRDDYLKGVFTGKDEAANKIRQIFTEVLANDH